jgi:hypothetical protein
MSMFVMQPEMSDYTGHMHQETLGWLEAGRRHGVDIKVFCDLKATPAVIAETKATPVFGLIWPDVDRYCRRDQHLDATDPYGQRLTNFTILTRSIARGCAVAWASARRPKVVVFPWATAGNMNGAAEWLADLAPEDRPAMVFNFLGPDFSWKVDRDTGNASGDFSYFRFASRRLVALTPPGKLLFTAIDARLCALTAKLIEAECRPSPLPQYYGGLSDMAADRDEMGVTIGLLGDPRWDKNEALSVDIVDVVCRAEPRARFLVQARGDDMALALAKQFDARGAHIRVRVSSGPLPRDQYLRLVASCDLMLLPYVAERYAMRGSGIFCDSLAIGLPVVAPAETWLSDRLAEGWGAGETFGVTDLPSILAATQRAMASLPALKARAAGGAAGWRAKYSVGAYMDQIMAWKAESQARAG